MQNSNKRHKKIGIIGFGNGVGDAIFAIKAAYCLKTICNAQVVYFGNKISKQILRNCDFIDECVNLGNISGGIIHDIGTAQIIAKSQCDAVILSELKSKSVRLLKKAGISRIICAMKIFSLFSWQCRTLPIYASKKYKNLSREEILIAFAKKCIARKDFDKKIKFLDWSDTKLKVDVSNIDFVNNFWNKTNIAKDCKASPHEKIYTILINPFNITSPHSISQNGYLQLIKQIAAMPQYRVIIPTYEAVHEKFMRDFELYFETSKMDISSEAEPKICSQDSQNIIKMAKNIYIFKNTADLLNLAALMQYISLCISPSTGTIHIASNQGTRTLGLFSKHDSIKWATNDKLYIIMDKKLLELSAQDEQNIITKILQILESMRIKETIKPVKFD